MNKDLPANPKLIDSVCELLLETAQNKQHTTYVSFRSCGISSLIKFNIHTNQKIKDSQAVFFYLDLDIFANSKAQGEKAAINFFKKTYFFPQAEQKNKKQNLEQELLDNSLEDILLLLTQQVKKDIVLVVSGARNLFLQEENTNELQAVLESYLIIDPQKITVFYINTFDTFGVDYFKLINSPYLAQTFNKNIVNHATYLLGVEDIDFQVKNLNYRNENLEKALTDEVKQMVKGDPALSRVLIERIVQKNKVNIRQAEDVIFLVGEEWIYNRYAHLFEDFSLQTLDFLRNLKTEPTEYLTRSGLASQDGKLLNEVFEYFLDSIKFSQILDENKFFKDSTQDFSKVLTPQENLVFEHLQQNANEIISRDEIAQILWGENYQESYSDWAITKVISKIRGKLEENGLDYELESVKGKGYVLRV